MITKWVPKADSVTPARTPRALKDMEQRSDAIADSLKQFGVASLKEKQLEAIHAFLDKRDTFVSLPTGYGKSLIYAILPLVFDKLKGKL